MSSRFDAIVVGAGPAGSSAALLLSRAGRSVALLEAHPFPRRKVCGECIAASNLALLEDLGVSEAMRRRAGPELRRVALWCAEERTEAALPACSDGDHPWGFAIGREHLDRVLLEQARTSGATVLQPCKALAIRGEARAASYEVDAWDGGVKISLQAPVIIRAHGSWQPPPADAGGNPWDRERRPSDLLAFKATFRNAALDAGLLPVLGFAGGYGGMVVAGDGMTTLACCIRRDRLAACRRYDGADTGAGESVEALLRHECGGVREALADASRVGAWLAAGPIRPGVRLRGGYRAFLIGNAAGEVHPIIGEGISMALQSAWLLCEELAGSPDAFRHDTRGELSRRQVHERYASRWRAHFRGRIRLAACFAHAAMRPGIAAALLPLLRGAPALLGVAARLSGKTRSAVTPSAAALRGLIQGSPT